MEDQAGGSPDQSSLLLYRRAYRPVHGGFLFFTNQQVTAWAVPGLSPIRHAPLHKKTSFPRNSGKDVFAIGPMRASEEKDSGEPQENEETAAIGDSRQENT